MKLKSQGFLYLEVKEIVTVPCPRASGEWLKYFRRFLHHVTDPEQIVVTQRLCTVKQDLTL